MVNETYGMLAILLQLINDFPMGFGSIAQSFKMHICTMKERGRKLLVLDYTI